MCENKIEQIIPTRYSCKSITMRCGSISIYGDQLLCDECIASGRRSIPLNECEDAGEDDFDPNWRYRP